MVLTGIDRTLREGLFRGLTIGLVTNPSAVTSDGKPTWKALLDGLWRIGAFFGPEHGFRGDAQDAVHIEDGEFRGIPSYSLYGSRLSPEPEMLEGLDAVVYDIQDVGCRYYTYLYTLANVISVCERVGRKVIVLDRPDPIGGELVEGSPVPDAESSFVGAWRLPPRYGMTVGEFARYLKGEFFHGLELEVVEAEGWRREELFDRTGLPWVSPSPNIPSLATALVYPGTCLFEGTELSEGRGTPRPFEAIGAPWIDGPDLRDRLAALRLPGVIFTAAAFTPVISKHKDSFCGGVTLHVTEPSAFRPLRTGIAMLKTIRDSYPDSFRWKADWENPAISWVDRLAGGRALRDAIDGGASLEELYALVGAGEAEFAALRKKYLLYA